MATLVDRLHAPSAAIAGRPAEVGAAASRAVGAVAGSVSRAATTNPPVAGAIAAAVVPARVAVARSRTAETVALAGLAGFGVLFALVRRNRTAAIDMALTIRIQARRHPALDHLMAAASWPGFPPQSRALPPAIIAALAAAGLRVEAVCATAGWGSALLSTLAKGFMGRKRPVAGTDLRVVAAPLGGSSFPSGHVLTYVGTYGFLAVLAASLIRQAPLRWSVVGGLVGLVALVGPSRIQQGHHWPTDVTASYLLGTSYLLGVTELYRRMKASSAKPAPR
ncbi:MAG TPA: phosphatase PAP2 family protein [Candidatus Limnocylindrales bacterium]|nr:phosphatase PAP2 family protein [Candidatus Limnocylindrales bacterium]